MEHTRRKFGAFVALGAAGVSGCLGGGDDPATDDESEEDDSDDTAADDTSENAEDDDGVGVEDQPDDAAIAFDTPADGATVTSPVEVKADVEAVDIVPPDDPVPGEGHVHVLVDNDCFEDGESIPGPSEEAEEEGIYHWPETEGEIELEPGEYDLCLQLGDGDHNAFGETDEITITVEEDDDDVGVEDQPDDAAISFVTPKDGATVTSPVEIKADVEAVDIVPPDDPAPGEAHVHVLVDNDCFEDGETIPGPSEEAEEEGIFHWPETEGEIELEPGEYDLCLQLGDGDHNAFGETDEITVTVEKG
ncbi:DUF4399 domain-containing protein [Natrialbaceae archaeon AArc-T1-2]|uniref:DUF4399 domain-containing protein n=1 Tax=Natrialbaceae archaeon AArc-T1-2 TaxID=3053904 RepID=UPI00255B01DA|nr:DUF4399 domain-containing protein [Natrialbaceae archaeon AArc-T1-2]WIV67674.1 DUF4399 domain-containing protein [Natrialbaceae archaeon AArc-T1-2]